MSSYNERKKAFSLLQQEFPLAHQWQDIKEVKRLSYIEYIRRYVFVLLGCVGSLLLAKFVHQTTMQMGACFVEGVHDPQYYMTYHLTGMYGSACLVLASIICLKYIIIDAVFLLKLQKFCAQPENVKQAMRDYVKRKNCEKHLNHILPNLSNSDFKALCSYVCYHNPWFVCFEKEADRRKKLSM